MRATKQPSTFLLKSRIVSNLELGVIHAIPGLLLVETYEKAAVCESHYNYVLLYISTKCSSGFRHTGSAIYVIGLYMAFEASIAIWY